MAERIEVAVKEFDPDSAWKALKKILSHGGDDDLRKAIEEGDDKKIEKTMVKNFNTMGGNLTAMGRLAHAVKENHPEVAKAYQHAIGLSMLAVHEWVALMGADPEVGENEYTQMWRFPQDDKQAYATCSWMISTIAENFIMQSFPIKNREELNKAMYNFFLHMAAIQAKEAMSEHSENIDYVGILENQKFLESTKDHEYIVDGVDCLDGIPGNKHFNELKKDMKNAS